MRCPEDTVEDIARNLACAGTPTQGVADAFVGHTVVFRWYGYVERLVILNRTKPSPLPGGCIRGLVGILPDLTDDACSEILSRSSPSTAPPHTPVVDEEPSRSHSLPVRVWKLVSNARIICVVVLSSHCHFILDQHQSVGGWRRRSPREVSSARN